jgi:uncharacterized protein with HEPN domain
MAESPAAVRLIDMIEAIELIDTEMKDVTMQEFAQDKRKRWLVERGIEIFSEASWRLPEALKLRHPQIPWQKVAGIGNILRHEYEHVAYDVLWRVVQDDLPVLEKVCSVELARAQDDNENS